MQRMLCESSRCTHIAAVLAHCFDFSSCCDFHGTAQSDATESKRSFQVCVGELVHAKRSAEDLRNVAALFGG